MPRSHIHGSPRRFHYGLNITDDPGNVNFSSPIRMHNGVTTSFDVSTKDSVGKGQVGDMSDTDCYCTTRFNTEMARFKRNDTCQGVCTADEKRFATV